YTYPFTAPVVIPSITFLLRAIYNTNNGITLIETEANIAPQFFAPNSLSKYNSPVCIVFNLEELIKVIENNKSFHLKKNCNTNTVTMAFFINGTTICHKSL